MREITVENAKAKTFQLEETIRLYIEKFESETGMRVDNVFISQVKKGQPDRVKLTVQLPNESDHVCRLCGKVSRNGTEHNYCSTIENNRDAFQEAAK